MTPTDGLGYEAWAGSTGGLLLCGLSIAAGLALLFLIFSSRFWGRSEPVTDPEPPEADRDPTGIRVVAVVPTVHGIVVDAIVDHGHALGDPGTPVTMVLEPDDDHDMALAGLRQWASDDAVLEVELAPGSWIVPSAADFRSGGRSIRLPVLFVQ
jgi:hypothetical protein